MTHANLATGDRAARPIDRNGEYFIRKFDEGIKNSRIQVIKRASTRRFVRPSSRSISDVSTQGKPRLKKKKVMKIIPEEKKK